jgi:hypothetical protein
MKGAVYRDRREKRGKRGDPRRFRARARARARNFASAMKVDLDVIMLTVEQNH